MSAEHAHARRVGEIDWSAWQAVDTATLVFVLREGEILLIDKKRGLGKGKVNGPGGKVDPGESVEACAIRECHEELGIEVIASSELVVVTHDYDHARVWLDTRLVTEFRGTAEGLEGQSIAWVEPETVPEFDILEAVHPILEALSAHHPVQPNL